MTYLIKQLKIDLTQDIFTKVKMYCINLLLNVSPSAKELSFFNQSSGDLLGNLFVVFVLMALITFSLMLTFNEQSAAIHKVLGLLLVSLFVVAL